MTLAFAIDRKDILLGRVFSFIKIPANREAYIFLWCLSVVIIPLMARLIWSFYIIFLKFSSIIL